MTVLTPAPAMTTNPSAITLDGFFDRVRHTNPFVIDRVTQPTLENDLDAEAVHQAQFRQLLDLARTARDQHSGIGAVLWGEAGVGKSHLLARLARRAHRDGQAGFVYLQNLQPGPENLPRCLLRVTVSILTRGQQDLFHATPLYRLVEAAVQTALQQNPLALEPEQAYAQLLDRLSAQAPAQPAFVDRTVYHVLFRFLCAAAPTRTAPDDGVAGLAVRWLSGDALDQDEAKLLGLAAQPNLDGGVALADNQQIKLVLVALSQMALFAQQPLLLCFDQVENVEPAQISALTRFMQAVLDSAPNLLVVTCGVKETLNHWREEGVIHMAAWDRVAQFEIDMPRVMPREARQIVETRLDHFLTPYLELEAVKNRVQADHLFPLGAKWYDEFLKDKADLRPRQVIRWARDGWIGGQRVLEQMGGTKWLANWTGWPWPPIERDTRSLEELIDDKVTEKLAEQKALRQSDPETLPPDADNLAGLTATLLKQCHSCKDKYALRAVRQPQPPKPKQRPTYHLIVEQQANAATITVGVLCLTTGNAATTAAFALRRLLDDRQPPAHLLLVTDCRRPLHLGAKGQEYLGQLQRTYGDRFRHIELTFDQYAELDALKATGGMALSRDLEIDLPGGEVRGVSETEVIASHHRRDRYAAHVLLGPLLGNWNVVPPKPDEKGQPPTTTKVKPIEQDIREHIMAQLALTLGASSHELTVRYVAYRKATNRPTVDVVACKPQLEAVAWTMHAEELVNVTTAGDGLFIMPRRK